MQENFSASFFFFILAAQQKLTHMKKYLLTSVVLFSVLSGLFGQISKGSVLLGGDISVYSEKQVVNNSDYKVSGIYFSPLFGKAIKDNLFFGGFLSIGTSDNSGANNNTPYEDHNYGAGIFLRKYAVIYNNFYGFIQGTLGVTSSNQEYQNSSLIKRKTVGLNFSPGISYKLSKKLHLETGFREVLSLGYSNERNESLNPILTYNGKSNRFFASSSISNFGSSLYFGFRLLMSKK
jgi:hypothetical protein